MGDESANKDEQPQSQQNPSTPPRTQSVKFDAPQSPPEETTDDQTKPTSGNQESVSTVPEATASKASSQTERSGDGLDNEHGPQQTAKPEGPGSPHDSKGSSNHSTRGSSRDTANDSRDEQELPKEAASRTSSPDQNGAAGDPTSRSGTSVATDTEYIVAEDGNIHINDKQKAAIRRLMHPEEQDEGAHLGFTKQGKPIKANPYYKYAQRAKDGAEETKPTPPPVTEPHSSRLTRRSRQDSAHLPKGPSVVLEKIKEEFCEWLSSLGSRRNMTVSKERLEELFSLGLENNLVVRPPEVCMTQPGHARKRRQSSRAPRQGAPMAATDARRKTEGMAVVAYCRSPSLTYYPELREKWRQMGLSRRMPIWRSGQHGLARPLPPRVHYGDWYIPIQKWSPLVAGRRLAPPETEEARQLRKRELANRKLNETLSRSHAMAALREYIHICQLQGNSAFPEATPKLVRDVDELVAEMAHGSRRPSRGGVDTRERMPSLPMAGLMVRVMDKGRQRRKSSVMRRGSRRPTVVLDRGPLIIKPPPMYKPVKTTPGHAARRKRRYTVTGKQQM
ncbi:uncharacterized protein LOC122394165 isoform X2 [Amphibalanus amphitrite]|uniref:uncharacterized protein LOC122394165 isoform X2 n=1 Tax=Amphibalanus amphitrite TaxID=1232801 RepID=UPI001C8FBD68|nr:uncharacterized protein LOC122394165 isoform X2 [Amphibalanus amphitrite]